MRWKQIEDQPKVFALIFETGDEIARVLQQFSKSQGLGGSSFKAIGALSYAKLGWFNWETKKYDQACVLDEQVERPFTLAYGVMLRLGMSVPAVAQDNGAQQPSAHQELQHIHSPQRARSNNSELHTCPPSDRLTSQ